MIPGPKTETVYDSGFRRDDGCMEREIARGTQAALLLGLIERMTGRIVNEA